MSKKEARTTRRRRTRTRTRTTVKRAREEESDEEGLLWRLVKGDFPGIFETHVVPKLNGNDVKFFYDVNRESRRAIQNSNAARLRDAFVIGDFDTKSTLSWALEKCSEQKERFCAQMARKGNVELLKFLRENGCPWDRFTCYKAAENGHLECLKYAHENGCPWGWKICSSAAENGDLECLKYAHEKGCPWNEETFNNAISFSRESESFMDRCLLYCFTQECPGAAKALRDEMLE